MIKKLISILLVIITIISLTGCNNSKLEPTIESITTEEVVPLVETQVEEPLYSHGDVLLTLDQEVEVPSARIVSAKNNKDFEEHEVQLFHWVSKDIIDLFKNNDATYITGHIKFITTHNKLVDADFKLSPKDSKNGENNRLELEFIMPTLDADYLILKVCHFYNKEYNIDVDNIYICGDISTLYQISFNYNDCAIKEAEYARVNAKIKEAFERGNGNGIVRTMPEINKMYEHKTINGELYYNLNGYWLPVVLGYPEYTMDELKQFYSGGPEVLKEKITSLGDARNYFLAMHYSHNAVYGQDYCMELTTTNRYPGSKAEYNKYFLTGISGKQSILLNYGECQPSASIVAYLLQDDYEEIGYIWVTNISQEFSCHFMLYFKNGDTYYIINPADFNSSNGANWSNNIYMDRSWSNIPQQTKSFEEVSQIFLDMNMFDLFYTYTTSSCIPPFNPYAPQPGVTGTTAGCFPVGCQLNVYTGNPPMYFQLTEDNLDYYNFLEIDYCKSVKELTKF